MNIRIVLLALALPLIAQAPPEKVNPVTGKKGGPSFGGAIRQELGPALEVDLSSEKPGMEPQNFLGIVGNWVVTEDQGKKVVMVDGRQWRKGQAAGGLAEKARAIYGSRHEEFIDNVKAFAYFPYAIARKVDDFRNGEIKVRFKLVEGQLDQCAGIVFNLKPNGDYLALRFNGKEDNVVLWTFYQGKRSFVKKGLRDVPLQLATWHELKVIVKDTRLEGWLDGELLLEYPMIQTVSGKVGIWSKTDSITLFNGFSVSAAR